MNLLGQWRHREDCSQGKGSIIIEFELESRVHLNGILRLGRLGKFHFDEHPPFEADETGHNKKGYEPRSSLLRLDFPEYDPCNTWLSVSSDDDTDFPTSYGREFASLLTLFTRTHFVLVRQSSHDVYSGLTRFRNAYPVSNWNDGGRVSLVNAQGAFDDLFSLYKDMREKTDAFRLAARFYHLGLAVSAQDYDLAYLCMCSAIECVSSFHDAGAASLEDLCSKAEDFLASKNVDPLVRKGLAGVLFEEKTFKTKWKFVEFIVAHLSDSFWSDTTRHSEAWAKFANQEDVRRAAKMVYNTRSKALHEGHRFPRFLPNTEKDTSGKAIPELRAFERITHHVLVDFLHSEARKYGSSLAQEL